MKINKIKNQKVIKTTDQILHKTQKQIEVIEKAKSKVNQYSSCKFTQFVNQMTNQIVSGPLPVNRNINTPEQGSTMKPDNFTNVQKVQQKFISKRGRARTKFGRRDSFYAGNQFGSASKSFKKKIIYDHTGKLQEGKQSDLDSSSLSSEINSKKASYQIDKKKQNDISEQEQKTKRKLLKLAQNRREKMYYNYQGIRQKVKTEPKGNLVQQQKSLMFQVLKRLQHKNRIKRRMTIIQPTSVQTFKVAEKKLSKKMKKKRKMTMIAPPKQNQPQKIDVKFSNISDLSDHFVCEEGICFSGRHFVLKKKTMSKASQQRIPSQRRYSKSEFERLRVKSITPKQLSSNFKKYNTIQDRSHSLPQVSFELNQQRQKYSEFSSKNINSYRSKNDMIQVNDQYLFQDLLNEEEKSNENNKSQEATLENQKSINISTVDYSTLSPTDKFNLQYIRNLNRKTLKRKKSKIQIHHLAQQLSLPHIEDNHKFIEQLKNPIIKNRQKLRYKGQIISQIKKKFQQNLRHYEKHTIDQLIK